MPEENTKNDDASKSNDEAESASAPSATTAETTPLISAELTTKEAYFASLNAWVKAANISQQAMALFPWYLLSSYPQIFQNQAAGISQPMVLPYPAASPPQSSQQQQQQQQRQVPNVAAAVDAAFAGGGGGAAAAVVAAAAPVAPNANVGAALGLGGFRILDEGAQAGIINRTGGYEYVVAPFWKRAVAEFIDVLLLLLIKIIVTFTVMNVFEFDMGIDLEKDVLRKALDEDDYAGFFVISLDFLAFSSDLLLLELATKTLVCFYEAMWTTMFNGSTPGKALMNLRIQYVEAVLMLQPPPGIVPPFLPRLIIGGANIGFPAQQNAPVRALLFPAETPNFARAFMRAVAKNLIMTLLFPMCFIMIFFRNNRTAYDIMTKTIVVEGSNANPVLRRQLR